MANIFFVHYNTPFISSILVKSIRKQCYNAKIYIFDNSDKLPFDKSILGDDCVYMDNTKGQLIDLEQLSLDFLKNNKIPLNRGTGSYKHCVTIQYFYENFNDDFILLDSDVIVKKNLAELINTQKCFVGQIQNRVLPMCMYMNTPLCKNKGIKYFDGQTVCPNKNVDTGYSFLKQCGNNYKEVNIFDYIAHYGATSQFGVFHDDKNYKVEKSSFDNKNHYLTESQIEWCNLYKRYWE